MQTNFIRLKEKYNSICSEENVAGVCCVYLYNACVYNKVVENSTSWDSLKLKRKPLP